MIDVGVCFKEPINLALFCVAVVLAALWVYPPLKNKTRISLFPLIVSNCALLIAWAVLAGIDHDTVTHLHLSWLVSCGFSPYRDFWQHHPPFFWAVLAPFIRLMPASSVVFDICRIFCGLVFSLNVFLGFKIAKKCWGDSCSASLYFALVTSGAIFSEVLFLRPDIFMIFFLLAGIYVTFDIPGERLLPSMCAGVAFALAYSFMLKQYLLIFLPCAAVCIGGPQRRWQKIGFYCIGLIIGSIPFFAYIYAQQILGEFAYWVLSFNKQIIVVSVSFPFVLCLAVLYGGYRLFKRSKESFQAAPLIAMWAFCLCSVSSLTRAYGFSGEYYLASWVFIAAICACGFDFSKLLGRIPQLSFRLYIGAMAAGMLIAPNIFAVAYFRNGVYAKDKKTISELMQYCAQDTCVALMPMHPVFAFDATRLYSYWQYFYADSFSSVRQDMGGAFAQRIMTLRPAVVLSRYQNNDFILELFQKGLISAREYKELVVFFRERYAQKEIGRERYYIRKDVMPG
jgi:hypothetical protein